MGESMKNELDSTSYLSLTPLGVKDVKEMLHAAGVRR